MFKTCISHYIKKHYIIDVDDIEEDKLYFSLFIHEETFNADFNLNIPIKGLILSKRNDFPILGCKLYADLDSQAARNKFCDEMKKWKGLNTSTTGVQSKESNDLFHAFSQEE